MLSEILMAIRAIGVRRTLRLVKAFSTSTSASSVFTGAYSSGFTSASASSEHLFGHSQLSGFGRPCPPSRHILARCRSWTELKDCKHWLITLDFPKDPKPTREEMIDTYVKTLAAVLGSVEEAKKKIYALSTTTYTGFQCNIDEATSERLKEQPLVNWVLPDGYGDPEVGIFGGDRYDNGVITPDPNPPRPYNERPRQRNYDRPRFDRQRDFRATDNMQGERRDFRPRPREGDNYRPIEGQDNNRPREGDNYRPLEGQDNNRPMEGRDPMQGGRRDYKPPYERREPMQGEQQDYRTPYGRREQCWENGESGCHLHLLTEEIHSNKTNEMQLMGDQEKQLDEKGDDTFQIPKQTEACVNAVALSFGELVPKSSYLMLIYSSVVFLCGYYMEGVDGRCSF